MNRNYIREDDDMANDFYIPQLSRAQKIAIAILVSALLVAGVMAVANAQAANTAVITYQAATTRTDGSTMTGAVSYEIWQGLKGATKTKIGTITSLQTTLTTGLLGGNEYCWYVITREAGNANPSAPSNEACKAFPIAAPNTVTITVQ